MAPLEIAVTEHDGMFGRCPVVWLAGEADVTTGGLADVLGAEAGRLPRLLVLEMSGLTFLDSWSLSVIVGAERVVAGGGGRLVLVSPSGSVARILGLTGVGGVLAVCGSVDEAVALAAGPGAVPGE